MFFNKIKKPCNLGKRTPEQRKKQKEKIAKFYAKRKEKQKF